MSTHVVTPGVTLKERADLPVRRSLRYLVPVGRALFSAIFLMAAPGHFSSETIAYGASHGVPLASLAVPLSGVLCFLGGASVLLGYKARIGGALLVIFLVPVTLMIHRFWGLPDPAAAELQRIMFMKNVAMLGGALLIMYFGAGPISFDARRFARRATG
jgi:putative oxidoreductase